MLIIFSGSGVRGNAVSEVCSKKFQKIIWKTVVMKYFLRKVPDLTPEIF